MSITADIQSLSPTALITLYELDMTKIAPGDRLYFHAGTSALQTNVIWRGQTYLALPVETEGFDITTKGTLPRPKFRLANMNGAFSGEVMANEDLIGCKVIRRRTFAKYLDAVNFPNGNPTADPNQHFPDETWYVDQKITENRYVIEWELSSAFDLNGVMLPGRQIIQNSCPWTYRSAECGYTGGYIDKNDHATPLPANDLCAKRLSSCIARFGSGVLPFGGFPGANRFEV